MSDADDRQDVSPPRPGGNPGLTRKAWRRLSDPTFQKTVAFIGSGLAALAVAGWQIYLHVSEAKSSSKPSAAVTNSANAIAAGGNVTASASSGATAVVATGPVTIGITLEQHEESLRRREREVRSEIASSTATTETAVALLQKQLADIENKLQDPSSDLREYKVNLTQAVAALESFRSVLSPGSREAARRALATGDPTQAEQLLKQVLTSGSQGQANAAYQLGVLAESRVQYEEASRYYAQATKLDPESAEFRYAAGRLKVTVAVDRFQKTGSRPDEGSSSLAGVEKVLNEAADAFAARGDWIQATDVLIDLNKVERILGRWDSAIAYADRAVEASRKARKPEREARALLGRSLAELALKRIQAAAASVEQGLRLAADKADLKLRFDLLDQHAAVQLAQRQISAAAETLDRAASLAASRDDLLFYAHFDRADVYFHTSDRCDQDPATSKTCLAALGRSQEEYERAAVVAHRLGWRGLEQVAHEQSELAHAKSALIKARQFDWAHGRP